MPNFNSVVLIGHLTRDPELKYSQGGTAICEFGLAVNSGTKENPETYFADCVCFGKTAENLPRFTQKGSCVLVDGRLRLEQWEDRQTGAKRSKTRIIANVIQYMDNKDRHAQYASGGDDSARQDQTEQSPEPKASVSPENQEGEFADDIPF